MNGREITVRELLLVLGVAVGLVLAFTLRSKVQPTPMVLPDKEAGIIVGAAEQPVVADPPIVKRIDAAAVRAKAMSVAESKLAVAEKEFAEAAANLASKHLAAIDQFFDERKAGIRPFAESILSLGGKWKFVKGQVWKEDEQKHAEFLRAEFEKHVFSPTELSEVVKQVVAGYLAELQGLENEFLVKMRADLGESDPDVAAVIPALASQEAFNKDFAKLAATAMTLVAKDLESDVAREIASFIAGEIAAKLGLKVLAGIGAKLGVSGGILATGAASSLATFGVGLLAAILADLAIDKLLQAAGHDPVTKTAERVEQSLTGIRDSIQDGIPEARQDWKELSDLALGDPDRAVREAAAKAAESIARSGNLGLRRELLHLHELRAAARREAIKTLISKETP
jgi:hypothetical protein